jgi:hypothetical protein
MSPSFRSFSFMFLLSFFLSFSFFFLSFSFL